MHELPGRAPALALAVFLLAGCSADRALEPCVEAAAGGAGYAARAMLLPASPFDDAFSAAAAAHDVDVALLKAIAWTETRLHMVVPEGQHEPGGHQAEHDHHGQPPAWGVMALRGERLERAARLAGVTIGDAQRSPAANIHAAAALLAAEAHDAGLAKLAAAAWAPALAQFSGIDLPAGRAAFAQQVLLAAGLSQVGRVEAGGSGAGSAARGAVGPVGSRSGHCPEDRPPPLPPLPPPAPAGTVWRTSPNFDTRMADAGGRVGMVIIHTCEGSYVGCWSWLTNPTSRVSAHYVVDEDGAEISQLVDEPQRAWHIGARYDCTLNRGRRCDLNDVQSNHFTIGVEHAGFASQTTFPTNQVDVSARLVCGVTQRHGIPRDGQHIVAHGQLQPWNRTDPGPNWPWIRYLALVQRHCGETLVDDDAAFNDPAHARVTASDVWTVSSATHGYHGGGYRWAPTHPERDDALVFEFLVEQAGARVIEARWTAGTNRSPAARFTLRDPAGNVIAAAEHDQRLYHDEWRPLVTAELVPGWHRVELSRRGAAGSVVIADAIRVR
jgi:N-acetyl-anhydromuramyl-L-alanine amidase AmpD